MALPIPKAPLLVVLDTALFCVKPAVVCAVACMLVWGVSVHIVTVFVSWEGVSLSELLYWLYYCQTNLLVCKHMFK